MAAVFLGAVIGGCRPAKDQEDAAAASGSDPGLADGSDFRIVVPSTFVGPLIVVLADSGTQGQVISGTRIVATPAKPIIRIPPTTTSGGLLGGIALVSERTGQLVRVASDCHALFDSTGTRERVACALPSAVVYRNGTHTPDYVAFVLATRDSIPQAYERAGRLLRDSVVHDAYAALPWKSPQRP